MKKILLVAMTLFFAVPDMQAKGDDDNVKIVLVKDANASSYYYEGVVPVEGVTKEELFKKAKDWVLSTFKTEDNNMQFDESVLTIISSSTVLLEKYKSYPADLMNFKLKLMFKDGRYMFHFDNVIIKSGVYPMFTPAPYDGDAKMFEAGGGLFAGKYRRSIVERANTALFNLSTVLENRLNGKDVSKDW